MLSDGEAALVNHLYEKHKPLIHLHFNLNLTFKNSIMKSLMPADGNFMLPRFIIIKGDMLFHNRVS